MMNNDAPRPAAPEKEKAGKRFLRKLKAVLTRNVGWKIGSLALAICLWGGLISQDTSLPRDKVIDGVRVTVTNVATLKTNGLVVVDGLDENMTVKVRVRVPQKYYSSVNASNYTARLDLNQILGTGEQTLKITAASSNTALYGTVTEVFTPEITVEVAEYATQARVPVEVRTMGDAPEGYYPAPITFSPQYVDIGGPKDVVEQAARCVVEYDQSTLSIDRNPNTVNLPFFFEDASGNRLDSGSLTVNTAGTTVAVQRIAISQYVYAMARVPVDKAHLVRGEVPEGYAITDIRVSPDTVTIAGREVAIAPYLEEGAALYPYEQIDVSRRQSSISTYLALRVPTTMEYVSNTVVQVSVTIEPVAVAASGEAETP